MNYSKYSNITPAQDAHDYIGSSLNLFKHNAVKNYRYCYAPTKMIRISTLPQVCGKKQALVLFEDEEQATEALVCKYASNIDGNTIHISFSQLQSI